MEYLIILWQDTPDIETSKIHHFSEKWRAEKFANEMKEKEEVDAIQLVEVQSCKYLYDRYRSNYE